MIRRSLFKIFVLVVAISAASLALVGCDTLSQRSENGLPMPVLSFAHIESVGLGVSQVEVVRKAEDVVQPDDFAFSFHDHAFSYLSRKFFAGPEVRDAGRLVLRIDRADVSKVYLPHQGGVAGLLDVGGQDRYMMDLTVAVDYVDWQGALIKGRSISMTRRLDVSEHVSISERESAQMRSIEAVFATLDSELERVVLDEMALGAL